LSEEEWTTQFDGLVERSYRGASADEKVNVLEAAVRLADHHGDVGRGYSAREALISAAVHGGHTDRAVVAFAWCRAQAKRDPTRFGGWHLLWENKWILESLHEHLGVTRAQIQEALDDYAAAIEGQGGSGRSVAKLRLMVAADMGEMDEARRFYDVFRDTLRDAHSDCEACDVCAIFTLHVRWGEDVEALRVGAPVLKGRLSCAHVPHDLLPWAARAYFRLGRLPEARDAYLRGYRMTLNNRRYLPGMGLFLGFLGLTDNHGPALTLFEKHLIWALETRAPPLAFHFYLGARFVFERAIAAGDTELALWLPRAFPLFRDDGVYDARALLAWANSQATDLCAQLDARNGNGHHMSLLERSRRWGEHVKPFPINTGIG
jgi:tetratricopeptide (TPR) repeat protein